MAKSRIFLVDDHPIMRQGLTALINQETDLEVCGEAEDASGALAGIDKTKPDLAVVDISLKNSNGIELIKDVKIRAPKLPVLVLSMHDESFYAERVLRAGAMGYVTKAEVSNVIVKGIRKVLAGEVYVSEALASKMLSRVVGGSSDMKSSPVSKLSDREFEVFELIGQGLQTKEIAHRLHLSIKTIDSHRDHIKSKLEIDNATDLLKYAIQWTQFERGN